jgi:hypothetical protein
MMNGLVIAIFLLLSLVMLVVAIRFSGHGGGVPRRSLAPLLTVFTLPLIGLAMLWRVPLDAQHFVEAEGASGPSMVNVNCSDLRAAIPALERVSSGTVRLDPSGQLKVNGGFWASASAQSRQPLLELADNAHRCLGTAGQPMVVQDLETGEVLYSSSR